MSEEMVSAALPHTRPAAPQPPSSELARLVHEHAAQVYRYAIRLSGSAADADDLTQQTFLLAQEKLDQLRERDKAGSWLLAIVRRCFLNSRRRKQPLPASDLDFDLDRAAEPADFEPSDIDPERVRQAIDRLPEPFRVVILMFYFEDLSYQQIADQLETPVGTVMSRLSRAKAYLRRSLGGAAE